jgi:TPR repeat protein
MDGQEFKQIEAGLLSRAATDASVFFELGLMYSSGHLAPVDLVSAHKWFNIAAAKGCADAARLRREIAAEMSDSQIGQAQLAAREWLKLHPQTAPRVQSPLRVAA